MLPWIVLFNVRTNSSSACDRRVSCCLGLHRSQTSEDLGRCPLGNQKSAIDAQRKTVQHGCTIGQEKTDDRSDVFALGKSTQWNTSQHRATLGRIAPGAFPHLR